MKPIVQISLDLTNIDEALETAAMAMCFKHAACGPMVRSSYHADRQAQGI